MGRRLICEEKYCNNEASINYKDLWMLCPTCKARWDRPTTEILHLPHPKTKIKPAKDLHAGEEFMFGPDAM